MSESMSEFIERVNQLEERFRGDPIDRYHHDWLMPKDLLKRVRDELVNPPLFATTTTARDATDLTRRKE